MLNYNHHLMWNAIHKPNPLAIMSGVTLQSFALGERVGRGRFGHVYKVQKKDTGHIYAMKMLIKEELRRNGVLDQLHNEVEIQSKMKHKYILRLLAVIQDAKRVYLFTEYAEHGNLYSALKRALTFPEHLAGKYLRQLLNALTYLHTKKIIHRSTNYFYAPVIRIRFVVTAIENNRDIKPENLLISSTGNLILADFGWCTISSDGDGRSTICGTPDYLPPEMIQHRQYSDSVDSWTCGILCFEFITGKAPFTGASNDETYDRIVAGVFVFPEEMSAGARHFISVSLRPGKNVSPVHHAYDLYLTPYSAHPSYAPMPFLKTP